MTPKQFNQEIANLQQATREQLIVVNALNDIDKLVGSKKQLHEADVDEVRKIISDARKRLNEARQSPFMPMP